MRQFLTGIFWYQSTTAAFETYKSAHLWKKNLKLGSQNTMYKELDTDRKKDVSGRLNIHTTGMVALLYFWKHCKEGCIVKTAGIDPSLFSFTGNAIIFESQDDAADGILKGAVKEGDVVIIRYEAKGWTWYAGDALPHFVS